MAVLKKDNTKFNQNYQFNIIVKTIEPIDAKKAEKLKNKNEVRGRSQTTLTRF